MAASQLDGLADVSFQELSQLPPEGGEEAGHPLARGPRSSRGGVKRPLADDAEDLAEIAEVMLSSPAKARRGASQRSVAIHLAESAAGTKGGRGQQLVRRQRAPRSPDEKRKLSRQMAAYMRYGVLVLPANVKLNKKNGKKDDDGGLEYRQAFNLLLDVCFGDSHKAWAHCANHFYLHAILVSMATDGAVKMDPVKEAAMDEHAMLRKASDQQNAQWRINEARLRTLGVKKEQLAKVFRCVAEGKPIALPAPPAEALWQPAIRARRQPGDDAPAVKASPSKPAAAVAAAPPARPTVHYHPPDLGSVPKHRQGANGGRKYTGFSPAALEAPLPAPPVPGAGASRARSAVRDNRGARRNADGGGMGAPDGIGQVPMQVSWMPQLQHQAGLSFGGRPGDLGLGSSLLGSSLMLWPHASFLHGAGAAAQVPPGGGGGAGGGVSQMDLGSMLRMLMQSQGRDPAEMQEVTKFLMASGMPQAEELSTGAALPGRTQPPAGPSAPAPAPLPAASPGGAPMAAALATAAAAKAVAAAGDGVDRVPGRTAAGEGMRPPPELTLTQRVTTSARELAALLRQLRDASDCKPAPDLSTKAGAALNDVYDLLWQQGYRGTPEHPLDALAVAPTLPYAPAA